MMKFASRNDFTNAGYKKIGEGVSDGQSSVSYWAKQESGQWGYLVVTETDDGYITNVTGLVNGKIL
jgi:hypothetical protein